MPTTRVLLDSTFAGAVNYYKTFPTEPIVKPDANLDIRLPIENADRIDSINLLALLTRMAALPGAEKQLLIITHGNDKGLPIPLAPGSKQHAEDENLYILTAVGKTLQQIPNMLNLPLDRQPEEFSKLLRSVKHFDGSAFFLDAPVDKRLAPEDDDGPDTPAKKQDRQKKAVATYQAIVEWTLNSIAGKNDPVPSGVTKAAKVFNLEVSRKQLDELLAKSNQVRGQFERIDFRGCNTGKSTKVLEVLRAFFGCKQVCAPDVVTFASDMTVVIDTKFDKDLENNIEALTRREAKGGRSPVKTDKATNSQVRISLTDMPMTRRFDTDQVRAGDEVFIRMWLTQMHPHMFYWWMRAISAAHVEEFVRDRIALDISRWKSRATVPVAGLWLVDDFNTSLTRPTPITIDPNAPIDLGRLAGAASDVCPAP